MSVGTTGARLLAFFLILFGASAFGQSYADSGVNSYSSATSVTCTLANPVSSGNTILVGASTIGGATVTGVTDGIGNTFTSVAAPLFPSTWRFTVYRSFNVASGSSDVITINFSGSDQGGCVAVRYASVATSPLDSSPTSDSGFLGGGGAAEPGAITTTNANDIIVGIG